MNTDEKLELGFKLQHIAFSVDDTTLAKIKPDLDYIEAAIIKLLNQLEVENNK